MIRRLALAALAAVAVASALPADAASKRVQLYYFGNTGEPSNQSCTQNLQLLAQPTPKDECTGNTLGANDTGLVDDETYNTAKTAQLKLDTSRPVTGTIYVVHIPVVSGGAADSLPNLPGYAKAVVTVKIDSVKVGEFPIEGVVAPVTGLKKDFSLPMPAALKNKTAKKVTVVVNWTDAVGLINVSYTDPQASTISVPLK